MQVPKTVEPAFVVAKTALPDVWLAHVIGTHGLTTALHVWFSRQSRVGVVCELPSVKPASHVP